MGIRRRSARWNRYRLRTGWLFEDALADGAYIYCLLNITDHPCPSILCMRQTGCCRGERVCSWTSSQGRLLAIRALNAQTGAIKKER